MQFATNHLEDKARLWKKMLWSYQTKCNFLANTDTAMCVGKLPAQLNAPSPDVIHGGGSIKNFGNKSRQVLVLVSGCAKLIQIFPICASAIYCMSRAEYKYRPHLSDFIY
ncbi:hypothetical protein GOODEAATRI_018480 [Goodea atripinnis]|uniref:Uncharacterized protein n=1 Tax=Goodea atripinnis TaxID=208336 RepID=A0ABV0MKV3_9TELE